VSFKLLKNISKKSTKDFLKKNKEKELFAQIKKITESFINSSKNLTKSSIHCFTNSTESSNFFFRKLIEDSRNIKSFTKLFEKLSISLQNFAESFKNISQFEKTRDEVSKIILLKLKTRHSEIFKNHKKSSYFIILSFFSEANMTNQHSERFDQNMQKMIQAIIREMMSEIIQQSVAATVNVIAATTRSNSSSVADHSQMISKATSKSRFDR
jgi:uncharacterized protein Yka (UPF0111/DUF47 family)